MALQLNQQMVKDAVSRAANALPALPNVLVRVMQLTETTNSGTVGEIEQLIKSDQAISSRLLRIVNSAYFGLSGQVSSVSQAVVILGFQQVRNLVLSVSMMTSFGASGSKSKASQIRLWESAFATASAAQMIARKKKIDAKDQELVFVGGLLQNIGSLFMLSVLSRSYVVVLEESIQNNQILFETENLRLGMNHAELGAEILKKWGLPENLILLVSRHEGPFAGEIIPTLAIINAAERVGDLVIGKKEFSFETIGLSQEILDYLDFDTSDFEWLMEETKLKVEAVFELVGAMDERED